MFEAELLAVMKADTALRSFHTVYSGSPAMFSNGVPEKVNFAYSTIDIKENKEESDRLIQAFDIAINFWDYGPSRAKANSAIKRLKTLLDGQTLNSTDYLCIRIRQDEGEHINTVDPLAINYVQMFSARGTKK